MSGLEGDVPRSFIKLRTVSKPEALKTRESLVPTSARLAGPGDGLDTRATAEILPPLPQRDEVLSHETVVRIAAIAAAVVFLFAMLALAAC